MSLFDKNEEITLKNICEIVELLEPSVRRYVYTYKIFVTQGKFADSKTNKFYSECIKIQNEVKIRLINRKEEKWTLPKIGKNLRIACGNEDELLIELLKKYDNFEYVIDIVIQAVEKKKPIKV